MLILEHGERLATAETAPLIFCDTDKPFILNWIARGSDGNLYIAPAIPGGWLHRKIYNGSISTLKAIAREKARTIAWFLYGDVGDVLIARR